MSGLFVLFQIGASFGQWVAAALALSLSLLHPAPRHPVPHRHEPVRLPELASAAQAAKSVRVS
ncbi:hypothetical protein [Novosphingobium sp.]|uniref:hypothetical protein n=1 Tax=Novosphingobium sp. TaxID=1874826 RepID=UPI003341B046